MRVFADFREAKNEIARDLNELGTKVFAGYQSMEVDESKREDLTTMELIDYDYIVLQPRFEDLDPVQPWADAEWEERLTGLKQRKVVNSYDLNPGKAWELRRDLWESLLEPKRPGTKPRQFSYTYAERFYEQDVDALVRGLKENPNSRQIYLSVWDPMLDDLRIGKRRVPCSLGYQITVREEKVNVAYHMRSSDFKTHFDNDLFMACKIQQFFADEVGLPRGRFVHKVGSLHVYQADVAHVF